MRTLAPLNHWHRWSVTALGSLLCGGVVISYIGLTTLHQLQIALPFLLALGLAAYGGWLAQSDLPSERITRITMWSLIGTIVIGSFALWAMYLHLIRGDPFVRETHELLLGATGGAIVGGVVGYYDVRQLEQHQESRRAHQAITASNDGIAILNEDGRYTEVNQAHVDVYGYEGPEDFIGESWRMCYTDADREVIEEEVFADLQETDYWRGELTGKRRDGSTFPQELTLTVCDDGSMVCIVRDITERKAREQELEQYEAIVRAMPDEVYTLDADGHITSLNVDHATTGYASDELIGEHMSAVLDEDDTAKGQEVIRELQTNDECKTVTFEMDLITRDGDRIPHENHVALLPHDDGGSRGMVGVLRDITERKQHEQTLVRHNETIESLHTATRDMVEVSDTEEICELVVDAARQILDIPNAAIWLSDDTGRRLEPIAQSEEESVVDEHPVYTPDGDSLSWQVFESGETRVYDDLRTETALANPETTMRSEIIVPLGEYGVMNLGSQTAHSFDETDVHAAELLGSNTATALKRAEHEQELNMQLDRMEFFNSILRHDVLNGMTVIRSRADFLTDELDGDQLRDAETILHWSDDIVEIVQRVRATLDTLTDQSDIPLEPVELSATLQEELSRVRDTYPGVTFDTALPDAVHVQANELLSEVLGNIITNAVDHNETEGLCVSITASERTEDSTAVLRIADNGTGVPDEAKEAIFRRDATGHAKSSGSGFGLFFVDSMVESYGGDIWVEDNDAGGATFVLELPLAEATTPA